MATTINTHTILEGTTTTGAYGRLELRLTTTPHPKENYSEITADLYFIAENRGSADMKIDLRSSISNGLFIGRYVRDNVTCYLSQSDKFITGNVSSDILYNPSVSATESVGTLAPGESEELWFASGKITDSGTSPHHNLDGTLQLEFAHNYNKITDATNGKNATLTTDLGATFRIDIPKIERAAVPVTADNFTDEDNPIFSYEVSTGESKAFYYRNSEFNDFERKDTIISLQAGLSFDGVTVDIPYRDIPIGSTAYTFNFTEAEREILRQKAQGSPTVPIYYMTKIVRQIQTTLYSTEYTETVELIGKTQRNLTIIGCNPTIAPTVKDIKPETLALTGDENTVIKYESMVEYAINATASKHAEIVNQSVTCGSKTITGLGQGIIDDVESELFVFKATDSRNLSAEATIQKNIIDYVKPTCYQKLSMEMAGEFDTRVKLKISGSYYNGSFGAADNELKLEVRHTQNDGSMGDWVELTDGLIPVFNGNTYELEVTISGFTYSQAYTFQCRATDKLNFVQSAEYTLRIYPVFDWGENDFNFNVPVNINNAEDGLMMNGETVLRHNATAKNTVLSGSGGHIYLRPGGTNSTYGETIIYPDGSIQFGGEVTFADGSTGGGAADYVIETGEESMGSNGTWYWTKWASGKAECYGRRNFGTMAVTTAWGNLYRSAAQEQTLPTDLFEDTPEAMNISLIDANYGGWIAKHETAAPSNASTGSFIIVRPASATISSSHITFNIIGRWK